MCELNQRGLEGPAVQWGKTTRKLLNITDLLIRVRDSVEFCPSLWMKASQNTASPDSDGLEFFVFRSPAESAVDTVVEL